MSVAILSRILLPHAMRCFGAYLAVGLTALALPTAFAQDQPAGKTTAVNTRARGTPPSEPTRLLMVGGNIFQRERVQTDNDGQAQLLFRDGSTITVGPNSDLVLDEYVYDPAAGTGRLAASLSTGLLRFVGGRISKDSPVSIKTPTGEVAVRGGVMLVSVDAGTGATSATFLYGKEMRLTGTKGNIEVITRPGFSSTIAPGGAPSPPLPVTAAVLQQMSKLEGRPGATGGASTRPTDALVTSSPLSGTLNTLSVAKNKQAAGWQQLKSTQENAVDQATTTAVSQISAQNAANDLAMRNVKGPPPVSPPSPPPPLPPRPPCIPSVSHC